MYRNPKLMWNSTKEKYALVKGYDYNYQGLVLKGYSEIYPEKMMLLGLMDSTLRDSSVDLNLVAELLEDVLLEDSNFRKQYNKFLEDSNIKVDSTYAKEFYDKEFAKLIQQCFSVTNPITKYDYLCCKIVNELDYNIPAKPKFMYGDFDLLKVIGEFKCMLDTAALRLSEENLHVSFELHFDAIIRAFEDITTGFINAPSLDKDVYNKMVKYLQVVMKGA